MGALANDEVGKFINEHCVSSFQKVATFRIVGKAKQGGNVASYFCAPDGRVLHVVPGPVNAAGGGPGLVHGDAVSAGVYKGTPVLDLDYDVDGRGSNVKADALLHASTVEGARIAEGLRGHLSYQGGQLAYGGAGRVDRIDLQRFGRALDVDALQAPRFRGYARFSFGPEEAAVTEGVRRIAELVRRAKQAA